MEKHMMKMNIAHNLSIGVPITRGVFLFLPGKWKTHCPDRECGVCAARTNTGVHIRVGAIKKKNRREDFRTA